MGPGPRILTPGISPRSRTAGPWVGEFGWQVAPRTYQVILLIPSGLRRQVGRRSPSFGLLNLTQGGRNGAMPFVRQRGNAP